MIDWFKRPQRMDDKMSERRLWRSRCGRYRVLETNIRYGRSFDKRGNYLGYPIFYSAQVNRGGDDWRTISEHRKRSPAVKMLEYYAENGRKPPKKTKASKAKKRLKAKRQARKSKEE